MLVYCHSEHRATSRNWKVLPNLFFFSDLGWGDGGVLCMRMQGILDSLFARPGSAPIGGREERRIQGLDYPAECKDFSTSFPGSSFSASLLEAGHVTTQNMGGKRIC